MLKASHQQEQKRRAIAGTDARVLREAQSTARMSVNIMIYYLSAQLLSKHHYSWSANRNKTELAIRQ